MYLPAFFNGLFHICHRFFTKALHLADLPEMLFQAENIRKFMNKSRIHKTEHRLNGKAVDIHSPLADKTGKFLDIFGCTVRIGTMQGLCATIFTHMNFCRCMAHRTLGWNLRSTYSIFYRNTFRNDLIGFDHGKCTLFSDSQTLDLADIA